MTVAIMQPYFFPYLPYFQLMHASDVFVCLDDVNFIKQGWINRNYLFNGKDKILFTVPLKKQSSFRKIKEIEICYSTNWDEKLLKTIRLIYGKAPYFESVYPLCESVLKKKSVGLSELTYTSLRTVAEYLNLTCKLIPSSSTFGLNDLDGEKRVISISKSLNAVSYINSLGGYELYSKENFLTEKIQLKFLKSKLTPYRQFNEPFVAHLSIIDVLMFNNVNETRSLLDEYQFI